MQSLTPMMKQYFEIKEKYEHCLLLYRLGDFYELFYDDAVTASRELNLTLTGRDCGQDQRAPMCGVPYHAVDNYISKLIEKGYKVAICEQTEDPKLTKTLVKRDVVRVITPGTQLDSGSLNEDYNNYLMCVFEDEETTGLSIADVTTGEFLTTEFSSGKGRLIDEIAKFRPSEIISNHKLTSADEIHKLFGKNPERTELKSFKYENAKKRLCDHFNVMNLQSMGIEDKRYAICASGALLEYLQENLCKTEGTALSSIAKITYYSDAKYMAIDASSRRNLELMESMRDRGKRASLLWVLDQTKTSMGSRLLKKWINQPLAAADEIIERHEAVEELKDSLYYRDELRSELCVVNDIERITTKITYNTVNCRDLVNLKNSLANLPRIKELISNFKSPLIKRIHEKLDTLGDICQMIAAAIIDEPPLSLKDGGFIRDGCDKELDRLNEIKTNSSGLLLEIESREREKTGIRNLRIKYNKVFGYFFEVTGSYQSLVPDYFIRRQTLSNCERYITKELLEVEETILSAGEKIIEIETKLFDDLKRRLNLIVERILFTAQIIAACDVLSTFAELADINNYTRPSITNSGEIRIVDGRHPVIEKVLDETFIPNDTFLSTESDRLIIITGPNMAGKSTYMRQVALIVLMAQMGCFVPARQAEISVVDKLFTRAGAADDLATGQSTFMVEMSEVSNILNNATKNSLIILDEIGRGTSTFDGLSIAWSVLEYIADKKILGAKTMFATHYHELTELEGGIEGIKNYCVTVSETDEDIIFLHKIAVGGADKSYGIQVAKLAGLPQSILTRSNEILKALSVTRGDQNIERNGGSSNRDVKYQRKIKSSDYSIIIREMSELDINNITKSDALQKLLNFHSLAKQLMKEAEYGN